jgi:hypothetical protein
MHVIIYALSSFKCAFLEYSPPFPAEIYVNPQVPQPYGPAQAEGVARTPAPPVRRLSGGLLFLLGTLVLLGSEIVRLVTLHSDPLDLLNYVIILVFALPASLLAIRSKKNGKCAAALILASLAMVLVLADLRGLITNTIHVMQNPLGAISPELQMSFLINKISYAIGHLVAVIGFLTMWVSLFKARRAM